MILLLLAVSCQKDPLDFQDAETATGSPVNLEGYRTKMPNPYTVANMQKAWKQIEKQVKGNHGVMAKGIAKLPQQPKIVPNLLYIKFTPQNEAQHNKIDGTTLALTDYPLGYAYEDAFFENRPPQKEGELRPLYTTVPVGTELPSGVPYEVLAEMYLPQEDEDLTQVASSFTYQTAKGKTVDVIGLLLNQAWTQKGVSLEDETDQAARNKQNNHLFGGLFGSKWLPEGTIRIWDDNIGSTVIRKKVFDHWETYPCVDLEGDHDKFNEILKASLFAPRCRRPVYRYDKIEIDGSYVPLVGAQILLRSIWTIGNEITNSEGYFRFDHKRGRKRYIIQWERARFDIRNGAFGQAETRGPKTDRAWNYDIKGGWTSYLGMINTACIDYYYGDRFGLTSPPTSGMKIAAVDKNDKSSYIYQRSQYYGSDIRIMAWGLSTSKVYGTTIHELAHAAHYALSPNSYDDIIYDAYIMPCVSNGGCWSDLGPTAKNNRRLLETWAFTVEIMFALKRYRDFANNPLYMYEDYNYQSIEIAYTGEDSFYTSCGYDMIDDFPQHEEFGSGYPRDFVSGFTIKELENALDGARSWWHWRDNLKSISGPETDQSLDVLFNNGTK